MKNESQILSMLKMWFDDINIHTNEKFILDNLKGAKLNQRFKRDILKVDENKAIVKLSYFCEGEQVSPFTINVTVCGLFQCEKWETDKQSTMLIKNNTTSILFPFLRQAISAITSMSGFPSLTIPIMNVLNLFDDKE